MILEHNKANPDSMADGVVITPSHNPPGDGGFKYNPPHGGPADVEITSWIEDRANQLMGEGNKDVRRITNCDYTIVILVPPLSTPNKVVSVIMVSLPLLSTK